MKKEIKSIYQDSSITFQYDIPDSYERSNPDYFIPAIELIKESTYLNYYEFPVVIYLFAYNENGELFNNKGTLVNWNVCNNSNYNTKPTHKLDYYMHQFSEFFKENSFIKKADCIDYISEAKISGFNNIKFSVGIWTNECILCERIFDFELGFKYLSKEFSDIIVKNKSVYYENPFLTKYCLEEIFVETTKRFNNNELGAELSQKLINLLFENKSNNKNSINDSFKINFETLINNINLIRVLEDSVDLLKTIVIIKLETKTIEVSMDTLLNIMMHHKEPDFEFNLLNSDIIMCVRDVLNDKPLSFRFELTDRMIRLAKKYNY